MTSVNTAASLTGKTAIVTGPTGLGFEIARGLAACGAEVVLAGRNPAKGAEAVTALIRASPQARVRFELLDLGDLASIRRFADHLATRPEAVDILVNNAGVMMPPVRQTTADGFELQLGINHLGHFALTARLLPLLRRVDGARIVTISSLAHRRGTIDLDDLQSERRYRPFPVYAQSKLANLLFAFELQRQSDCHGWGLISAAAHPGFARTDLIANGPGRDAWSARIGGLLEHWLSQSAEGGAQPALLAATAADAAAGSYYGPRGMMEFKGSPGPAKTAPLARDAGLARRLWTLSEQLVGLSFSGPAAGTG